MHMCMVIKRFSVLLGILLWWSLSSGRFSVVAAELAEDQVQNEMELLAQRLPCFLVNEFLWDRMDDRFMERTDWMSPAAWRECQEVLAKINDRERYSTKALVALLEHANPRVRTLALAALFAKEDGHLLPFIYPLTRDQAPTFDAYAPRLPGERPLAFPGGMPAPKKEHTVGQVAGKMLHAYLEAGNGVRQFREFNRQQYESYWETRKDRQWCGSWFAVQLARATQRTTPVSPKRQSWVQAVYQRLSSLPPLDRAWCCLWLDGEGLTNAEPALLEAGKTLGPDRLLALLQGRIDCADPDIQSTRQPLMGSFVLRHAADLLRPEQADAVMQCAGNEGLKIVAVARLLPRRARQLLHNALAQQDPQAFGTSPERALQAATLWDLEGSHDLDFLLKWFYEEPQNPNAFPHTVASFLGHVTAHPRSDNAQLAEAIIRHERFDILDEQSLRELTALVKQSTAKANITSDELWNYLNNSSQSVGLARLRNRLREQFGLPTHPLALAPKPGSTNVPIASLKHTFLVNEIRFSPDSRYLASRTQEQDFMLWECPSFKLVWQSPRQGSDKNSMEYLTNRAFSVGFNMKDTELLTMGWHGQRTSMCLCHWSLTNMPAGPQIIPFQPDTYVMDCESAFSADGLWLATGGNQNRVMVFSARTGQMQWQTPSTGLSAIQVLAFSPDNQILATGGTDHLVRLWDVITGHLLRTLDRHSGFVKALAFSPDSGLLASGGEDDCIHLWECGTGRRLFTLLADNNYVLDVAFTPDGQSLAMNHHQGELRLWSVADGSPQPSLSFGSRNLHNYRLAFSPDNQFIAVGSEFTIKILPR
jgi:WD40 repeat protein